MWCNTRIVLWSIFGLQKSEYEIGLPKYSHQNMNVTHIVGLFGTGSGYSSGVTIGRHGAVCVCLWASDLS